MDTPPPDDLPPPIILPTADLPPMDEAVILQPSAPPRTSLWRSRQMVFALIFLGVGIAEVVMLLLGGSAQQFASVGLELSPFVLLSILAYAGERSDSLKIVTLVYWLLLLVRCASSACL